MAQPGDAHNTRAYSFYIGAGVATVVYVALVLTGKGAFVVAVIALLPFLIVALIISGTITWAVGGLLAQQDIWHRNPRVAAPIATPEPRPSTPTRNRPAEG